MMFYDFKCSSNAVSTEPTSWRYFQMAYQTLKSFSKRTRPGISSATFAHARVYWLTEKQRTEPRDALIRIATSVRWVYVKPDDLTPPKQLSKFRSFFCLALQRIQEPATWKNIERKFELIEVNAGHAYVFPANSRVAIFGCSRIITYDWSLHLTLRM